MSDAPKSNPSVLLRLVDGSLRLLSELRLTLGRTSWFEYHDRFRELGRWIATLPTYERERQIATLLAHVRVYYLDEGIDDGIIYRIELAVQDRIATAAEVRTLHESDLIADLGEIYTRVQSLRYRLPGPLNPQGGFKNLRDALEQLSRDEAIDDIAMGSALLAIDSQSIRRAAEFSQQLAVTWYFGYLLLKNGIRAV